MRKYLCGIYTSTRTINRGQSVRKRHGDRRTGTVRFVFHEPGVGRVADVLWLDGHTQLCPTSDLRKVRDAGDWRAA